LHFNKYSRNTLLISRILSRGLKKSLFSTKTGKLYLFESIESSVLMWLVVLVEFIKGKKMVIYKICMAEASGVLTLSTK